MMIDGIQSGRILFRTVSPLLIIVNVMKSGIRYILVLGLFLALFSACSQMEKEDAGRDEFTFIKVSVNGEIQSRASGDVGTAIHSVNRILVIPFQKLNKNLSDNLATNFIPAWNFAHQWDVSSFPAQSLTLKLPKEFTYKVMVIGYNQNDYDFYNPGSASNRISIKNQPLPTTLANFQLAPKSPANVPELFLCYCTASQGSTLIGPVFTPTANQDITLTGTLKRFVSGLGVYLTDIPGFVKSITLRAGRMVKAVQVNDTLPVSVQAPGDGESRIIQKSVPAAGALRFNVFLMPTLATYSTPLFLDIEYDSIVESYPVKVPNSAVSVSNNIILLPNGAVTITGSYTKINYGFEISRSINLDDNVWDGLQ